MMYFFSLGSAIIAVICAGIAIYFSCQAKKCQQKILAYEIQKNKANIDVMPEILNSKLEVSIKNTGAHSAVNLKVNFSYPYESNDFNEHHQQNNMSVGNLAPYAHRSVALFIKKGAGGVDEHTIVQVNCSYKDGVSEQPQNNQHWFLVVSNDSKTPVYRLSEISEEYAEIISRNSVRC